MSSTQPKAPQARWLGQGSPSITGRTGKKTENALNTSMWFEGHVFRSGLKE